MAVHPRSLLRVFSLWIPVIFWMGVIFKASSLPGKDIPALFPYQDIVFHSFVYAALAFFLKRALKNTWEKISPGKIMVLTLVFCVCYGLSDEFHQLFVPNRSADFFDVGIDSIGSLIGSLLYR